MNVKKIFFKDYRNLKNAEINPCKGLNVICGNNAQGKTNFLEAIWIFTGGRSFRGSKDKELTTFGKKVSQLKLQVNSFDREQLLKIDINSGKRFVEINKVPQQTASSLIGYLCAVVFSPVHMALIKDGPRVRRKFLDTAICQLKSNYVSHLIKYNHVLNQRNILLRNLRKSKNLIDTLDIWDETLADYGSEIIEQRSFYVKRLKNLAKHFYSGLSSEKEALDLNYKTFTLEEDFQNKNQIKEDFIQKIKESREDDITLGFTTKGPHRDDIDIRINNRSARLFSSQGQQRSAVLAMKLAEAELVRQLIGEMPIILLDDVLSELDLDRQRYLLNSISKEQVFITCCEPEFTKWLSNGQIFEVSEGSFNLKVKEKRV